MMTCLTDWSKTTDTINYMEIKEETIFENDIRWYFHLYRHKMTYELNNFVECWGE